MFSGGSKEKKAAYLEKAGAMNEGRPIDSSVVSVKKRRLFRPSHFMAGLLMLCAAWFLNKPLKEIFSMQGVNATVIGSTQSTIVLFFTMGMIIMGLVTIITAFTSTAEENEESYY